MYRRQLFLLVIISSVIRLLVAATVELGNDEVYYYTYALHLQENYFDHPPGVGLLIWLFSANLFFKSELFIRLGAVVCAALGTVASYGIGKELRNARTGWFAALLYNTSIYACIIAGTFILPDSPQILWWLLSLWLLLRLVSKKNMTVYRWMAFGVTAGLCIMCKVHGGFLWIGAGLYALLYDRSLFKQPGFYLAGIITAIIISPIYFWNASNDFITWRFHSERVEVHGFSIDKDSFIQTLLGQVFYNNPLNVVLIVMALLGYQRYRFTAKSSYRLLSLCAWPLILFTTIISLFRTVLPHWSGPGFVTLIFVAAAYLDYRLQARPQARIRLLIPYAAGLILIILTGGALAINFFPGTLGKKEEARYGDGDFTLDMYGWQSFGQQFRSWKQQQVKAGHLPAGIATVCDKWFPAAHIEYYVNLPESGHVTGVGKLTDLHHYAWLNEYRGKLPLTKQALCIVPSNYYQDVNSTYGLYFQKAVFLKRFAVNRAGKPARYFNVYLLDGYKGNDELFSNQFN
ncbi:ArnT family glycosyltransferase [Foetidibacter luteolus]|uniref:ArnT family glycosyltransferase n=1 Tax=Foetidibacter luteolus TaxID=2608880 RepID=UPI00129AF6F2|nr:glycosyltransferase family 39 protein [Foetidibacter luteolus]